MAAIGPGDVDRVRELTSIGAGHAANVLASLLGQTCSMRVPSVAPWARVPAAADARGEAAPTTVGVLFEVEGPLAGVVGLLIATEVCDRLVEELLGSRAPGAPVYDAESALREVGNILVSHVVSAMADTLGVALLPSVPELALADARAALAARVGRRAGSGSALQFETEISDPTGALRARLVFVPDRSAMIAAPRGF